MEAGISVLKNEYPETIARELGLKPLPGIGGPWMSSEGTVLKEWLEAVGGVLGVPYRGEKVRTMRALLEAVGEPWDSSCASQHTVSGGGGNITEVAFERLLRGVRRHRP